MASFVELVSLGADCRRSHTSLRCNDLEVVDSRPDASPGLSSTKVHVEGYPRDGVRFMLLFKFPALRGMLS